MAHPDPHVIADRANELEEATEQMRRAADHGKNVSRLINNAYDASNPDSFESDMRRLLGRLP